MERRIRRLGIFIVLCFLALFIQLNNIQVFRSNALANSPGNPRIVNAQRSETRGSILSADGTTLASSVLAPKGSIYKYQRVYNPFTANIFSQITGFAPSIFGNYRGIESEYNSYLTPHTRPAKTLRDLLVNRTEVDNVTLTVTEKLQAQVAAAINATGVVGAAAVVEDPATGAIEAMYSNPSYDPNTLVSQNTKTDETNWNALIALKGLANPVVPGTYDQTNPPGSSFKVVTTSAVLEHSPALTSMIYPSVASVDLPGTGTPAQKLTNYHNGVCPENGPGPLEQLLIESCDADFASIGQALGAPTLVGQAEAYGFNGKVPLDVPSDTVATSNFGTVSSFDPENVGVAGLMKSAIGQENVTASALQMAMVAGTVANGGNEMTPHLMEQIRDTQGSLVTSYTPSVWKTPISAGTAATLTTFMQGVVQKGTAAPVGFPASWNVAAKTGTAQTGSFSADPPFTTDWLIAFAPVGQSKVAIAVVVPNQPGSATGATVSGPIVKQILGDVLADQS